jgi:23S rRNA-/tRNA-specific pseudouridylate synthase
MAVMNEATTTSLPDNPCWGGPDAQHHTLEHLLNVLVDKTTPIISQSDYASFLDHIHQRLIIFQDDNYLVINKPPDLRMDGAYGASVHKLLLYLFPPPSLRASALGSELNLPGKDINEHALIYKGEGKSCDEAKAAISFRDHRLLLQKIASLSKHSCLKDDPFRIVHQLDYATSGVLLYARSKRAAGAACKSFQERQTRKQYVAVVVNSNANVEDPPLGLKFLESLPILPSSCLSEWEDGSLEKRYKKKRKRETDARTTKKDAFDGFMPVHSVFAKWRSSLLRLRKEKEGCDQKPQSKPRQKKKSNDNLPPLPKPEQPLTNEEVDEVLSLGHSWKEVKNNTGEHSRCWVAAIETMAKEYNQALSEFYANNDDSKKVSFKSEHETEGIKNDNASLPPLFRLSEKPDANSEANVDSFYMCAAIGEPKDGRFDVLVDPSVSKVPQTNSEVEAPMAPALTKGTVLWRGCMRVNDLNDTTVPVTKVLLQPLTGRRHQLRVHLARVAGFPILGDVTYGGNIELTAGAASQSGGGDSNRCHAVDTRVACRRMCLHAKKLTIPLLEGNVDTFEAPDPFRIACEDDFQTEKLEVL